MQHIEKLAAQYIYWPEIKNPFQSNIDFSENKISTLTPLLKDAIAALRTSPEEAIVTFYTLNQYLSEQRIKEGNILDDDLLDIYQEYQTCIGNLSKKMFAYIFCITLMEARHSYDFKGQDGEIDEQNNEWGEKFERKHGRFPDGSEYRIQREKILLKHQKKSLARYKDDCPDGFYAKFSRSYQLMMKMYNKGLSTYRDGMVESFMEDLGTSDITIADLMKTLSIIFGKSTKEDADYENFESGYGGGPWKEIADHGLKFAKGEINAEVFVDQAFSLEHNGGCMFNKAIIFQNMGEAFIPVVKPAKDLKRAYFNTLPVNIAQSKFLLDLQHQGHILNFLHLSTHSYHDIKKYSNAVSQNVVLSSGNDSYMSSSYSLKNIDMKKSVYDFLRAMQKEAKKYTDLPLIRKIMEKNASNVSGIDFKEMYAKQTYYYGDRVRHESLLLSTKAIQGILQQKSQKAPIKPQKYTQKNVFFEILDTSQISPEKSNKNTLGGKGFGLSQMHSMDLPVPPSLIFPCENSRSYSQQPDAWRIKLNQEIERLHAFNQDKDGQPMMVSVRSGAPLSMPGMMDTILNVGIDNDTYPYFVRKLGRSTADECAIRFMKLYTKSSFDIEVKWPKTLLACSKKFRKILVKHGHYHNDEANNKVLDNLDSFDDKTENTKKDKKAIWSKEILKFMETTMDYQHEAIASVDTLSAEKKSHKNNTKRDTSGDVSNASGKRPNHTNHISNKTSRHPCDKVLAPGIFPLNAQQQISLCIETVFNSWNSPRAVAYRKHHQIDDNLGTAAIMQHMVLGNLNDMSCTGVLFSRDCINGHPGIIGEFLVCGQGEEVVSGEVTPTNISDMKEWNIDAYEKLSAIATLLEEKTGHIQDIEFTVENGEIYILQCRTAVSSPSAKMKLLEEKLHDGRINFQDFLGEIDHVALHPTHYVDTKEKAQFQGLSANPGVISGICITNTEDIQAYQEKATANNLKFILISEETKPEHAELMMKSDGFLTQRGGFTSHAAILARSWGKPCIVGCADSSALVAGDVVTLDAKIGAVWREVQPVALHKERDLVANILQRHPVDLGSIDNPEKIRQINAVKPWMQLSSKTKEITPPVKKFNKFLEMGELAIMKMSVAAKNHRKMHGI